MKTTAEIRQAFLDYFAANGHEIVPSSSLIPHNDPTLLFTNAGMVQFKNVFTGEEKRPYSTATSSQKCLRAGGKHNDLENVGHTARHHTFFEMLGNFSFGDYFKEGAIELAWNLMTKDFGLSPDKLLVTVHSSDEEAAGYWKKITGFSDEKIIRIPTSDNFWSMGETGPCGPCTEIFYDHGEDIPGGPPGSPDEDGDRFVEIWNLVFMQYDQVTKDKRVELPKPCVDTGMGLERMTAVLQGVHNNYDIDLFQALIHASVEASGVAAKGEALVSHRVISDHLRASGFLISDGVLPSNEGRGYVLRRIMRRAMRHAHMLGCKDSLMYRLVPALVGEMGQAFPELLRAEALMTETFRLEEERFKQTLERGLKLLQEEVSQLKDKEPLPGKVAFKLYDTFGFPIDLTEDVLKAEGRPVDSAGFDNAMNAQREAARANWVGSGEEKESPVWLDLREQHGKTEFLGYQTDEAEGQIIALVKDGKVLDKANAGDEIQILANQTPFYAESGGQIGDTGVITTSSGAEIVVLNTEKRAGQLHVHVAKIDKGSVESGQTALLKVDAERRDLLRTSHSATHILHAALRHHLGDQVTQKGSLVEPGRFRFDFSYNKPLTEKDLYRIETDVNYIITKNTPVETHLMQTEEALESGAIALFGEKYDEEVRVVSMGDSLEHDQKTFSVEFCGGTHVRRTGDIGYFKITSETGIAAGIRRIEAMTSLAAVAHSKEREQMLGDAAAVLKVRPSQLAERLQSLLDERKKLEKDLAKARQQGGAGGGDVQQADVGGVTLISRVLEDVPPKDLKPMADQLKTKIGSGVVAVTTVNEGRASIVIAVTNDLTDRISAVDLVKVGSEALGGQGGGGRPDMAQAGGPDGSKASNVFDVLKKALGA